MDFDRKDGFSYLDGIPMKISAKFIPPRPVALPIAFDAELPPDLLSEQYDFSLERRVLESEQKRLSELKAAKSKAMPQDASARFESMSNSSHLGGIKQAANSNALPWHSNSILQPKLQQVKDQVTNLDAEDKPKKINLSDFENDTSSPFDYMELQTINDFEELSSVFQDLTNKSSDNLPVENLNQSDVVEEKSEPLSNVSKSISFPLSQNTNNKEKIASSCSNNFLLGAVTGSEPKPVFQNDQSQPYPSVSDHVEQLNSFDDQLNFPSNASRFTALSEVPYISSHGLRHRSETSGDYTSSERTVLRGCKSYSDIHNLSDVATNICSEPERSRTPPSNMFATKVIESSIPSVKENGAHPQNSHCDQSAIPTNGDLNCDKSSNSFGLPDPYDELEESAQVIVDSITDMGFSRGQVSRAVKHLGVDEKKVVDHLCQIQSFVESGYDSLEAEAALHLNDYNIDEAKTFMDLVNKFQDLGFEKVAIRKALVQNKNDWNKTIDTLLT